MGEHDSEVSALKKKMEDVVVEKDKILKELVESKQERDSVLCLKETEIKEAVEAKEELMLTVSTADERISQLVRERDTEVSKSESLLDKQKSAELSFDKLTTEINDVMDSKSELTSQIAMISSDR